MDRQRAQARQGRDPRQHDPGVVGLGGRARRGRQGQVAAGPIAERCADLGGVGAEHAVGEPHQGVQGAARDARRQGRQIGRQGAPNAEPGDLPVEEGAGVGLPPPVAQHRGPPVAAEGLDRRGLGQEPVAVAVDGKKGRHPVSVRPHAVERDQDHREMVGQHVGELDAVGQRRLQKIGEIAPGGAAKRKRGSGHATSGGGGLRNGRARSGPWPTRAVRCRWSEIPGRASAAKGCRGLRRSQRRRLRQAAHGGRLLVQRPPDTLRAVTQPSTIRHRCMP